MFGIEIVSEILISNSSCTNYRFTFGLPLLQTTIKNADIRMAKSLKHECTSVCEPSLLTIINHDGVRFADVKALCDHAEIILTWHHERIWRLNVSCQFEVQVSCTFNVFFEVSKHWILSLTHDNGAVQDTNTTCCH